MAKHGIKSGPLVNLPVLQPSSLFFGEGASLRVTGKLQEYTAETAIAMVAEGDVPRINTDTLEEH